uniref:Reverse transcriptase/retrotransposon-derived protein RNase H-like domain-containing protein n=1 Tax=Oryzias latipes TaxID=8090 RepID=A0A3B3IGJ4_ORYLA
MYSVLLRLTFMPLLSRHENLKMTSPVNWKPEADKVYCDIKQALVSTIALALPGYSKPFVQMVNCKAKMRPVAYISTKLVACALPHCIRALIAALMVVEISQLNTTLLMLVNFLQIVY